MDVDELKLVVDLVVMLRRITVVEVVSGGTALFVGLTTIVLFDLHVVDVVVSIIVRLTIVLSSGIIVVNLLVEVSFRCDESLMHTSEMRAKFKFI